VAWQRLKAGVLARDQRYREDAEVSLEFALLGRTQASSGHSVAAGRGRQPMENLVE